MLRKVSASVIAASALMILVLACTKQTPFGGDLLDDQLADYNFTDTISMRVSVSREDSALITSDRSTADYLLCGELNDPLFGKSSAEIYTLLQTSNSALNFQNPRFRYDSIVMFIRINGDGIYGDTLQEQTLRIHRLAEAINTSDKVNYYSNSTIPTGEQIAEFKFMPRPSKKDSLVSTTARGSYVRIKLPDTFGQELFGYDSLTYVTDSTFEMKLRGLKISSSSAGASPGAMLGLDLNDTDFSFMNLYFTRDDSVKAIFKYQFLNARKFVSFKHDYAGSPVENSIDKPVSELAYAQGMGGLRFKVEFPWASNYENIAVNKAELVMTVAEQPGDNSLLFPTEQFLVLQKQNDTTFTVINDIIESVGASGSQGYGRFGGYPIKKTVNGQAVIEYRFTLTQHFQDIIDDNGGNKDDKSVWFTVTPQIRTVNRSVFFGPKSTQFPMKLEMKYTNIR
jgi:Domain of unknown function (DUF4270)